MSDNYSLLYFSICQFSFRYRRIDVIILKLCDPQTIEVLDTPKYSHLVDKLLRPQIQGQGLNPRKFFLKIFYNAANFHWPGNVLCVVTRLIVW